jgi:HPt (histidine-containing phosphotransfer) domain-containing protein
MNSNITPGPLVDFTFVYDLSGDDKAYIYNVISIYLSTIPAKLAYIEQLVHAGTDYEQIAEVAHFLKSSSSVIVVRDMLPYLSEIEQLAKHKNGINEIVEKLNHVLFNFNESLPLLHAEMEKNKPVV